MFSPDEWVRDIADLNRTSENRAAILSSYELALSPLACKSVVRHVLRQAALRLGIADHLETSLEEIAIIEKRKHADRQARCKSIGQKLKNLPPGTRIHTRDPRCKEPVTFLEMKRTRFVCSYPNGRQYSVPADWFKEVVADHPDRCVNDEG